MSDYSATSPTADAEKAAHEVILELCRNGTFGVSGPNAANGPRAGREIGDAIVEIHKKLTEHYKSLK